MNASFATELSPLEPGSIKDRVVCTVSAIGPNATRSGIRASVKCDASILEIAIDALERDGYIHMTGDGYYILHGSLVPSYVFNRSDKPTTATSTASLILPTQDGDDAMTMKLCKGPCGLPKPLSDFYSGCAQCKRCTLDRQAALKKAKRIEDGRAVKPEKVAAKKKAPRVAAPSTEAPKSLVIPASGEITCKQFQGGVLLNQLENEVFCSFHQLAALRAFITSAMEKKQL